MRTIEVKLFSYDELSEKAKENALEKYRATEEYFWFDDGLKSIKWGLALFDFKLSKRYNIDLLGVSNIKLISHHIEDAVEELYGLRLQKYIYNTYYDRIYELRDFLKGDKVRRSRIMVDRRYSYTGYCADVIFLDELYEFMAKPDNRTFKELMMDCCEAVINDMQKDYAYQLSEEYFRERCFGNNCEFYEDGEMA